MFVDDIVKANLLAATQPTAEGEIFNIGTGVGSSLNELIAILNQVSGRDNPVIYTDPRPGEIKNSRANIDKARQTLGYNPKTTFKEGLSLTWKR